MYELVIISAVPALDEDGGVAKVLNVLSRSWHQTVEAAEARAYQGIKGEVIVWGDYGWIPKGSLEYAISNPGKPILMAIIS